MPHFEQACRTTQGARAYQEDFALVHPGATPFAPARDGGSVGERLLAVLADGMGGHAGGARASRTICETFRNTFVAEGVPPATALVHALDAANVAIREIVDAEPSLDGMGATLIGVALAPEGISWISVGDSPLMLVRNGELTVLNEDHSMAPMLDELARQGVISQAAAEQDHRRHMLRSAVSGEEIELIDLRKEPLALEPGDVVILASDGILTLEQDAIARLARAYGADGAGEIADALIRNVESARLPYQDNTTVVVIRCTA